MSIKPIETPNTTDDLKVAAQVLGTEAEALQRLAESLDENFVEALNTMEAATGRVIITGMGKSGHVGKKIAATMASTGTPAFFVHPAEASHGDMGMIIKGDVVLAISNSGESKELGDLIEYTRRRSIPLIAITKRIESTLGSRSDIALILPDEPEACPNGLAPTTSTTLTIALGDALAVALLARKGFTAKDFKQYHPGGKLGQQLMKASEIMHTGDQLPVVQEDTPMQEAIDTINAKSLGCAVVVDNQNRIAGIITDGDLRRQLEKDILNCNAKDIMSPNPKTITETTMVASAMAIMNGTDGSNRKITSLLVETEQGELAGLLHIHDCLKAGFA